MKPLRSPFGDAEDRIVHWCMPGCKCGGSKESAIQCLVELLFGLFITMMPQTVTFSRWTTLGPFTTWVAMCLIPHRIFFRAWELAFGRQAREVLPEAPDVDIGEELSPRQSGAAVF